MKRSTRNWLRSVARYDDDTLREILPTEAQALLDSDARLRAELRRKDKALKQIAKGACSTFRGCAFSDEDESCDGCAAAAALRKPHSTRSRR